MDYHTIPTNGPRHYTTSEVVYGFIQAYVRQEGYPPGLAEIAEGCGLDVSAVAYHLKRLRLWGFICRAPGGGRRIALVDQVRRRRRQAAWPG